VRQRKEAFRHGERFVDLLLRNTVVDKLEETDLGRCRPELLGDFGLPLIEVAYVDAWDIAGFRCANAAESPLLLSSARP
jgi:hypothetical protein